MGPVISAVYLLQHTATIMIRQSDQVLQERLGIGIAQFRILMMLQTCPNVQQRKLAEALGQTEASVSRQIRLLCDRGLLAVQVNPKSRREHITIITAKGSKLTEAAVDVLEQYHRPMLAQMGAKQQAQFITALNLCHTHVCGPGKPFACDHPFKK